MKQGKFFPQFLIIILAAIISLTLITYHNITGSNEEQGKVKNLPQNILKQYQEGNNKIFYQEITGKLAACEAMHTFFTQFEQCPTVNAYQDIHYPPNTYPIINAAPCTPDKKQYTDSFTQLFTKALTTLTPATPEALPPRYYDLIYTIQTNSITAQATTTTPIDGTIHYAINPSYNLTLSPSFGQTLQLLTDLSKQTSCITDRTCTLPQGLTVADDQTMPASKNFLFMKGTLILDGCINQQQPLHLAYDLTNTPP